MIETVYSNEEKSCLMVLRTPLLFRKENAALQSKQALIQKEYELYKSEVQLRTHTNPMQL